MTAQHYRIGIDLGGSKIEGLLIDDHGNEFLRLRIDSPKGHYPSTIDAIGEMVARLEQSIGIEGAPLGLGIPGSISERSELVRNANSTWLNGQNLRADLDAYFTAKGTPRPLRIANDANCFVLSEARDGAGQWAQSVFGVIIGTGVGGGILRDGKIVDGPLGIGGEWGHNALPWPNEDEFHTAPSCWCGRKGCMEAWISGPGLAGDHLRTTGVAATAEEIFERSQVGDTAAQTTLARHADRFARGLAAVINIIDPEVVVLGGGLSKMPHLYDALPSLMLPHIFADAPDVAVLPPRWGDASGVRGAAWLAGMDGPA